MAAILAWRTTFTNELMGAQRIIISVTWQMKYSIKRLKINEFEIEQ